MGDIKVVECCYVNKQTTSSSVSEGSGSGLIKSPGCCSPTTVSPAYRRTTGPIRRAKGGWTPDEDETLRSAVAYFKGKSWKKIAEFFPDRSEVQCLHRWQKVLNPDLVKGPWAPEEDEMIIELVAAYGPTKWSVIAKSLPGRIGKQCRERWHNHLNPEIKKDAWTIEEEVLLINAHRTNGNKWAEIAKVLPGRTDNSIKNHWNSSLKKKLDFYEATGKLAPATEDHTNGEQRTTEPPNMNRLELGASRNGIPASSFDVACKKPNCGSETSMERVIDSKYLGSSDRLLAVNGAHYKESRHSSVDMRKAKLCNIKTKSKDWEESCENQTLSKGAESSFRTENGMGLCCQMITQNGVDDNHSTAYGPLCYERPQVDAESLGSFITPPREKTMLSPESILRNAAKSFPNTPSILRKRRMVSDGTKNASVHEKEARGEIKTGERGLCDRPQNLKALNGSPPYRLNSKRSAVFKPVERQLQFAFENGSNNTVQNHSLSDDI